MKSLGKIIYKLEQFNVYIVHIGLGILKFCNTDEPLEIGDVILYGCNYQEEYDTDYLDDKIIYIDNLANYKYIGNLNFEDNHGSFATWKTYPSKVIVRKGDFLLWERVEYYSEIDNTTYCHCENGELDKASNYLLFLLYAENRYIEPNECDFLKIYLEARKKVESYDLLKCINNLKVEIRNSSFTRRGSDNYMFSSSSIVSSYNVFDKYT